MTEQKINPEKVTKPIQLLAAWVRFKENHGVEFVDRLGVVNFTSKQAEPFKNKWEKIIDQLPN